MHTADAPNNNLSHHEYLADPSQDCREILASKLLCVLQGEGSIVVYSKFEETIITGLARRFLPMKDELLALLTRIVDLEKIIKKNYCHPEFHGRTSIKVTLPVLVDRLSYDDLRIQDGDMAMTMFACMALGTLQHALVEDMRTALLDYCRQDTLAMVLLHERLAEIDSVEQKRITRA